VVGLAHLRRFRGKRPPILTLRPQLRPFDY
jgi:hypothetical protein